MYVNFVGTFLVLKLSVNFVNNKKNSILFDLLMYIFRHPVNEIHPASHSSCKYPHPIHSFVVDKSMMTKMSDNLLELKIELHNWNNLLLL